MSPLFFIYIFLFFKGRNNRIEYKSPQKWFDIKIKEKKWGHRENEIKEQKRKKKLTKKSSWRVINLPASRIYKRECPYKSYGDHRKSRGHGCFESSLSHGFPLPDQCNRLYGPGCKSRQLPLTLSPPNPCWFHRCSIGATFPANTKRYGGKEPKS